ncbi:DUF3667 domain-containing protein [Neolewinella lacunae]|uniref:DUF3667 domain-containing protein n=1 Tax=Neolewinella lacunae TaxID=1517758 RepID=A0A923PN48_9BACT|nr:DUF3667 domain-containing protein [Neolewinella lacunae]MBC6996509.1 DUF3667 domain-containing protein [Neolewinella lacunae]MDN3636662.1 DUF3667 domain-containing protein [Neolewinella lacunae]
MQPENEVHCLNCGTTFRGEFCPACGQRANTRRFTAGYLFSRDFLEETFNFDRGFLRTVKELLTRPGYLVADYLAGKRKRYFNFLGLLLILLAIEALLSSLGYNSVAAVMQESLGASLQNSKNFVPLTVEDVEEVLRNQKLIFLIVVPLTALLHRLILKRLGYNFLEHCVIVTFVLSLNTLTGLANGIIGLFPMDYGLYKNAVQILSLLVLAYDLWLFWQLSSSSTYTRAGRVWRAAMSWLVFTLVLAMSLQFSIGVLSGYNNYESPAEKPAGEVARPDSTGTLAAPMN